MRAEQTTFSVTGTNATSETNKCPASLLGGYFQTEICRRSIYNIAKTLLTPITHWLSFPPSPLAC